MAAATTWNPSDKSSNITLSNGDLTAQDDEASWQGVRCNTGKSSSGWYFEVTIDETNFGRIGIATLSETLTYPGATTAGYSYGQNGAKYYDGGYDYFGATLVIGDVVGVAFTASKLWFAKNNYWQANGDPVAGTNPAFNIAAGTYYPMVGLYGNGNQLTGNFGYPYPIYAPPSGFSTFDTASSSSSSSRSSSSRSSSSVSDSSSSRSSSVSSSSVSSSSVSSSCQSSSSRSSSKSSSSQGRYPAQSILGLTLDVSEADRGVGAIINGVAVGGIIAYPGGWGMFGKQTIINKLSIPDQAIQADVLGVSENVANAIQADVLGVESTDYASGKQILLGKIGAHVPDIIIVNETGSLKRTITLDGASIIEKIDSFNIAYNETSIHNSIDILSYDKNLFQLANPATNYGLSRITATVGTRVMYFLIERITGSEENFTIFGRSISARDDTPYSAAVEVDLADEKMASQIATDVLNYNSLDWQTTDWNLPKNYSYEGSPIQHISKLAQMVRAIVRCKDDGTIYVRNAFTTRPIYMQGAAPDISYERVDHLLAADFSIDIGTNESEVEVDGYGATLQLPTIEVEEREDQSQGVDVFIRVYWVNEIPKILDDLVTDGILADEGEKTEAVEKEIVAFENGEGNTKYPIHSLGTVSWIGSPTAGSLSYEQYSPTLSGDDGAFAVAYVSYTTAYHRYRAHAHMVEAILAAAFLDEEVGISVLVKFGDGGNEAKAISDGNLTSTEAVKQRGIAYLDANKYNQKVLTIEVPYDDEAIDGKLAYVNDAEILCAGNFAITSSQISVDGPKVVNRLGLKQCQIS